MAGVPGNHRAGTKRESDRWGPRVAEEYLPKEMVNLKLKLDSIDPPNKINLGKL